MDEPTLGQCLTLKIDSPCQSESGLYGSHAHVASSLFLCTVQRLHTAYAVNALIDAAVWTISDI